MFPEWSGEEGRWAALSPSSREAQIERRLSQVGQVIPESPDQEVQVKAFLERAAETLRRAQAVHEAIAAHAETGRLKTAARPHDGGALSEIPRKLWNTDRLPERFAMCMVSLSDPFRAPKAAAPGRPFLGIDREFKWIFVETESLQALLAAKTPSAKADIREHDPSVPPKRKGGRPPKVDWKLVEGEVFRQMDHHGEFDVNDKQWNVQARLEDAIMTFCSEKLKVQVGLTVVRKRVPAMIEAWRESKVRN
jgi:hypothetical protein